MAIRHPTALTAILTVIGVIQVANARWTTTAHS